MATCFHFAVKSVVGISLIASLLYIGCLSWWVVEVVKDHPTEDYNHNTTISDRTLFAVRLSCGGIGLFAVLCQGIGSLSLIFNCGDYQKSHSRKWAVAQIFLLIIVILVYFLPFAFSSSGGYHTSKEFWDKVTSHTSQGLSMKQFHNAEQSLTLGFYIHSTLNIFSVILILMLWKCVNRGYTPVK